LNRVGFWVLFVAVALVHLVALQANISNKSAISKPKATIHKITLSKVLVKKPVVVPPKPKVEPIILPPDPEPVIEKPKPIILPPDPEPIVKKAKKRKKKKKKTKHKPKKKKKVIKKIIEPEIIYEQPIVEEVIVEPIVEQVITPVVSVDTSSIKDAYTSQIRRKIRENLFYPRIAKRLRMQGVVEVSFRVLKNGQITDVRILNTPQELLKKGAIQTLKRVTLRAIPNELNEQYMDITIPIEFRLIRR